MVKATCLEIEIEIGAFKRKRPCMKIRHIKNSKRKGVTVFKACSYPLPNFHSTSHQERENGRKGGKKKREGPLGAFGVRKCRSSFKCKNFSFLSFSLSFHEVWNDVLCMGLLFSKLRLCGYVWRWGEMFLVVRWKRRTLPWANIKVLLKTLESLKRMNVKWNVGS